MVSKLLLDQNRKVFLRIEDSCSVDPQIADGRSQKEYLLAEEGKKGLRGMHSTPYWGKIRATKKGDAQYRSKNA